MPLVRVALPRGRSETFKAAVSDGIHRALVDTIAIPPEDRFQILTEHDRAELVFDPGYLGISRGEGFLAVQITLSSGRTVDQKRALYARIVENLAGDPGVRPEDVLINLVEVVKENWSFGNGEAQYAR